MSEHQKITRLAEPQGAPVERGLATDTVAAVISGVSGGVAGAVVTQGMAKLGGGDKSKQKS